MTRVLAHLVLALGLSAEVAAPVPPPPAAEKPLAVAAVEEGDTVFMVWDWSGHTEVLECRVRRGLVGAQKRGLRLEWDDEDELSGRAWTALDESVTVFKTQAGAGKHAALLLRKRALDLLRRADAFDPPPPDIARAGPKAEPRKNARHAPVPKRPPAPDPVVPGFQWFDDDFQVWLEVTAVDGDVVSFKNAVNPLREYQFHHPAGPNRESKANVLAMVARVKKLYAPPAPVEAAPPPRTAPRRGLAPAPHAPGRGKLEVEFEFRPLPQKVMAPVPRHLFPKAEDPIKPGFRWRNWNYTLEVTRVEGDVVHFRHARHHGATFMGDAGLGFNAMYRSTLEKVLKECPQPPTPPYPQPPTPE